MKTDWEAGNYETFASVLEEYVPLDLMGVAMSTFNLLRIPFQTQRPVADRFAGCLLRGRIQLTSAWCTILYYTDILGDWTKFREFLELADKMQQLSVAYCYIPDADTFWMQMDRLFEGTQPAPWPTPTGVAAVVRFNLMRNLESNPAGQQPTDRNGDPIDQARLHRALRLN